MWCLHITILVIFHIAKYFFTAELNLNEFTNWWVSTRLSFKCGEVFFLCRKRINKNRHFALIHFRRQFSMYSPCFLHLKMHWPLQLHTAVASYHHIKPRPGPESPAHVDMGPSAWHVFSMSRASQVSCNRSTVGTSMLCWCTDLVQIAD